MDITLLKNLYYDVAALKKDWFADEDSSFSYNIVKAESIHEMGYAVAGDGGTGTTS